MIAVIARYRRHRKSSELTVGAQRSAEAGFSSFFPDNGGHGDPPYFYYLIENKIVISFRPQGGPAMAGKYILYTHEQKEYDFCMKTPKTLQEAIVYFSDPERAFQYAVRLRWPAGQGT